MLINLYTLQYMLAISASLCMSDSISYVNMLMAFILQICICIFIECGIMSGGDWLQGPHVYALYDSYGMTTYQIEILFVAGFGSSMIFGMVVGPFADR